MPIRIDSMEPSWLARSLVGLARSHQLTAYEAAYLELALRTGASLATQDAALARAARRGGVQLFVD